MTLNEFIQEVSKAERPKELRHGQWLVNSLSMVRPDLGNQMTADKPFDPFYDDSRIPAFWVWLGEHW